MSDQYAETVRACAYCHGYSEAGNGTVIHATRFQPGQQTGTVVAYWFCDDGCRQSWLDRAEQSDGPAICENCGKTMADHGPLANCYPLDNNGTTS